MRLLTSIMLSTALIAITGCGIGQKSIVGKWDCKTDGVTYADGQSDRYEYTSDGAQIIKIATGNPEPIVGSWKAIDGNRFTSTFNGKDGVREYKFEGEKLLFKSSSNDTYPMKCDRAK